MKPQPSSVSEFDDRANPPRPADKSESRPADSADKVVYPFNQQTQRPQ